MAEVVERNIQNSLDEILYIKKAKLFNKSEVNEIIRKRRQHEYALQKRNKRVMDYDSYILTELTILKLLRFRRKKNDDRRFTDKIERSIISRLVRLHRQLCYRFQSRVDVWIRFIKFFKILGRHVSAVRVWNRLLQVHGRTDPRLWAAAASYHLHQNAKAKVRTRLRKLALQVKDLTTEKQKVQSELKALTRFLDQKKQAKIAEVLGNLRGTRSDLQASMKQLTRERRLLHDQTSLYSIREARRLLTEGLTLNPQSKLLLIELAKLEACAADFFRQRVSERAESLLTQASEEDDKQKPRKRRKRVPKLVEEDNVTFMADVVEDVEFVSSGKAFRLVVESILNQWASDRWTLENLQQLLTSMPQLDEDSSLQSRLSQALEKLKAEPCTSKEQKQPEISSKDELKSTLTERFTELHNVVQKDGIHVALDLWNSWYPTSDIRKDQFRLLDPGLPEAVALLRLRLELCSLHRMWPNEGDSLAQAKHKVESQELIQKTRSWLDALATSLWGQKSADFWFAYTRFENSVGDCTRIPAIYWRANKTLHPSVYDEFTRMLNQSS